MARQLHINLFVQSRGHHEGSWRHPKATPKALTDISYLQEMAQLAERGKLDSVFLADQLNVTQDATRAPRNWLEPITVLPAIAAVTERVGLIATASSTYSEPFNLARQFASIDHISGGRAAWNIVTSWSAAAASNFGDESQISHSDRYARAEEYIQVVKALWSSWDEGAIVDNRATGEYIREGSFRPINHKGALYSVAGPLNAPRGPQGRPVLVQAGSSDTGKAFAARHAEAVFTAHLELKTAKDFYSDLKARALEFGRDPEHVIILPGLSPMIGSTELEAQQFSEELDALTDPEIGRKRLSARFGGYDFSHLPLDVPLRPEDFPTPETVEAARSRAETIVGFVKREQATLRQLLTKLAGARGHFTFAGTPNQVADLMETWVEAKAADGFNLMPPVLPWMAEIFIDEVLPILRKRGLFREEYSGSTLRDHLGLPKPS
jgi:FMN-dependent oxidoreductase (nitrilotriacetate monooxygenase family)